MSATRRIGARELLDTVLDEGSWVSWDAPPLSVAEPGSPYAADLASAAATGDHAPDRRERGEREGPDPPADHRAPPRSRRDREDRLRALESASAAAATSAPYTA